MRYDNEGDDVNQIDPLDCLLLPLMMTCGNKILGTLQGNSSTGIYAHTLQYFTMVLIKRINLMGTFIMK